MEIWSVVGLLNRSEGTRLVAPLAVQHNEPVLALRDGVLLQVTKRRDDGWCFGHVVYEPPPQVTTTTTTTAPAAPSTARSHCGGRHTRGLDLRGGRDRHKEPLESRWRAVGEP